MYGFRLVDMITGRIAVATAVATLNRKDDACVLDAAAVIAEAFGVGEEPAEIDRDGAVNYLMDFVRFSIDNRRFAWAVAILWPKEVITFGPKFIKWMWSRLNDDGITELLIMGAGSLGKSYTIGVWTMMNWLYDPENTCVKVVSMTVQHASTNMFAIMKNLHANALIPLPGRVTETSIHVERPDGTVDKKQGIHLVAIPQGKKETGSGRLQGMHPSNRLTPHHRFGTLTRSVIVLDEAEKIPFGVWDDLDNFLLTKSDGGHVKVVASTNPEDKTSKFSARAEPKDGWESVDVETAEEWKSRLGWWVMRLDGARFENVVEKRIVFPGFLTFEGYGRYVALGEKSPTYFTMARGFYPTGSVYGIVVPEDIWARAKGQFMFQGRTFYCLSLDLAFEGGDKPMATIARWGTATGWTDRTGKLHTFPIPKHGVQIEQQFSLKRGDSLQMVDEFISTAKLLHVQPFWMVIDKTSATTFYDLLNSRLQKKKRDDSYDIEIGSGDEDFRKVLGVNYGEGATDMPIMDDSEHKASDVYDGVNTELWYSGRHFMEFDLIKVGQMVSTKDLDRQITQRKYRHVKERVRVQPKKEYKADGNPSPDEADSMLQIVHLIRMRKKFVAQMIAENPIDDQASIESNVGYVDNKPFVDMSS